MTRMEELLPLEIPLDLLFGQRSQLKGVPYFYPTKRNEVNTYYGFLFPDSPSLQMKHQ